MTTTSPMTFDGQVAIVTGAGFADGLGFAYAQFLADRGAKVVINDIGAAPDGVGDPEENVAQRAARRITESGGIAVADNHSVATPEGARGVIATALEAFGRIDIVINNAGIAIFEPFETMTAEQFQKLIGVHLFGTIFMCQAAFPHMKAAGYGRIVNITSGSLLGQDTLTAYSAAKAGIVGFTRTLAREAAPAGVIVNALGPTAFTRAVEKLVSDEIRATIEGAMRRESVAEVVGYLSHRDCSVQGQTIVAGGGRAALLYFQETPGYISADLTMEQVRDNIDRVLDLEGSNFVTGAVENAGWSAGLIADKLAASGN